MSDTDDLYRKPLPEVPPFEFDERTALVFKDMIERSVPGYHLLLQLLGPIARRYLLADTCCYDLGCSLGDGTARLLPWLPDNARIIAVDTSAAMATRCRNRFIDEPRVTVLQQDLLDLALEPASLIIMNFTLQFIDDAARPALLSRLRHALIPGGALLLAEKTAFAAPATQNLMDDLHTGFKQDQGYSDTEIAQKRAALDGVLITNSLREHRRRLGTAGFAAVIPIFQALNFQAVLALRDSDTAH